MNKYQDSLDNFVKALSHFTNFKSIHDWKSNLQELVDKATPKKPKNWKAERRLNGAVEFNCPVCNRLYTERVNFCASCGQAIDWGTYK
ncbi:hypothetical protein [Solobacterium moorei]|uniref:hypothetical protein n=1 Tax=Solobacterium moorei TaxID=102148 RepID=UPI00056A0586|nr:hypothetical protein [Solobacterium moorei]BET21288.1 hypothetical protein RGT18_08760 [Solobacterium moorei]